MSKIYLKFAENFSGLNPFELKHLSECILCKIEDEFEEKLCGISSKIELTKKEIECALIEAMKDILLELRKHESQRERMKINMKLKETKVLLFADRKLVA